MRRTGMYMDYDRARRTHHIATCFKGRAGRRLKRDHAASDPLSLIGKIILWMHWMFVAKEFFAT